ncbi:hypothetical protein DFJ77DRAFT_462799 [Powellomyces hirtus]|nr:hypothetical protein DFJ77DRAFT_462799 [Powellomyces hirtus]
MAEPPATAAAAFQEHSAPTAVASSLPEANAGLRLRVNSTSPAEPPTPTTTTPVTPASTSTPTSPNKPAGASGSTSLDKPEEEEGNEFECNICLETASNPILTLCGHLYCWPCLHYWMESRSPFAKACPVCKARVEKDKLVPIYAAGRKNDPRQQAVPERPRAEAPPTVTRNGPWDAFRFPGGAIHGNGVAFGFGVFPQLFGAQTTIGAHRTVWTGTRPTNMQQQAFISRAFMMTGILVMLAILLY